MPHGCGKKYYSNFYVYGNFKNGILDGPAINSHDHYMYTMFFKENRGNGWGLCINGVYLVEFGYYEPELGIKVLTGSSTLSASAACHGSRGYTRWHRH